MAQKTFEMLSIHEMRRRAPLHYLAKAENARYVAFVLDQRLSEDALSRAAEALPYGGTPGIAVGEGFYREAALALELIVKAVIAQKLELGVAPKYVEKVRPSHDVPRLWADAGLPKIQNKDRRILHLVKRILYWSGRYAAPKDDDQYEKEREEERALKPAAAPGVLAFERPLVLDWETFDRIYGIAAEEFWRLRSHTDSAAVDIGE